MNGETNLKILLKTLSPELAPGEFVFCTFAKSSYGQHANLKPVASVVEDEGLTLIVPLEHAQAHNIEHDGVFRRITLKVHSSLEAVGLTAVFATKLAENDISANTVAGFFHDHIYVPAADASKAVAALTELSNNES